MSEHLNIGIIGAGSISRLHLQALNANSRAEVTWMADPDLEAAHQRAEQFGVGRVTGDYRDVLADPEVDAVDVLTPNHLHAPITVAAMEAGKDVICIKPMARNLTECDRMLAAAEVTGRRLIVSFHQRYDPVHRRVKELLEAGLFPRPVAGTVRLCRHDIGKIEAPDNWYGDPDQVGGGRFYSSGSHPVNLLIFWLGPVKRVQGVTRRLVAETAEPDLEAQRTGSDDHAMGVLEFAGGTLVTLFCSWANPTRVLETCLYGTDDALRVSVQNEGNVNRLQRLERGGTWSVLGEQEDWWNRSFRPTLDHHVEVLLRPPAAGGEDFGDSGDLVNHGRHTSQVLLACYESSQTGRTVEI